MFKEWRAGFFTTCILLFWVSHTVVTATISYHKPFNTFIDHQKTWKHNHSLQLKSTSKDHKPLISINKHQKPPISNQETIEQLLTHFIDPIHARQLRVKEVNVVPYATWVFVVGVGCSGKAMGTMKKQGQPPSIRKCKGEKMGWMMMGICFLIASPKKTYKSKFQLSHRLKNGPFLHLLGHYDDANFALFLKLNFGTISLDCW